MTRLPGPVVDADWLARHRAEVILTDVRWYLDGRSGRAAHEAVRLPGARFVDVDADLSATPGGVAGRHPMPSPEAFARAMGRLGIGDAAAVVAYDDTGGSTAARLVWMLRALGRPAALLDGGMAAWTGPLESGPAPEPAPAAFTPAPWPAELLATADDVAGTAGRPLLDARLGPRYRGETEPVDPRAGHIPGAASLPWPELLGEDGRILPPPALRARFARAGVGGRDRATAYCGSGVTACALLVCLEIAGLPPGRLFGPSWSGWSSDPDRPAATGEAP